MTDSSDFYKDLLASLYEGVYFVDRDRVVTYWNRAAEDLTGFVVDEVIGRCCRDQILMHLDKWGHSLCDPDRCPALAVMSDGKEREIEVCYNHKEGHRVPALARFIPYRNGNGEIIGAIEVFQDTTPVMNEREKIRELEKLALLDPLTELPNRRCAEIRLRDKLSELERHGWGFGLLFCDLDHFKEVNDQYGHGAGDLLLRTVARSMRKNLRASDFVCRWGGDEFLVILPNVGRHGLARVADKLVRIVGQTSVSLNGYAIRISQSVGGTLARREDNLETLLTRVDERMYQSKGAGSEKVNV